MSRRGNNEGSIYKRRDGRWAAALTIIKGKRHTIYGKTRSEVASKLASAIRDRDAGIQRPVGHQTLSEFLIYWLKTIQPTVRHSTFVRYEQYIRLHTIPTIGHLRLRQLTSQCIQQLYADKISAGLSPTSVRHLHSVLHRALKHATRWNLVTNNVIESVDPPRRLRYECQPLTLVQVSSLLSAAKWDRLEALYVLAVTTGLRRGELLGLRWSDVDTEKGNLRVRQTLLRGGSIGEPKTAKGRRQVELANIAVSALIRHRENQINERLIADLNWIDTGLVFTNSLGNFIDPDNLRNRSFEPLLLQAGLPPIRFHDLRHTAATLLLESDSHPKVVQEILGHSQISITMDIYSHVLPTIQRESVNKIDVLLGQTD